jgi:hypothetical protein
MRITWVADLEPSSAYLGLLELDKNVHCEYHAQNGDHGFDQHTGDPSKQTFSRSEHQTLHPTSFLIALIGSTPVGSSGTMMSSMVPLR